MKNVTLVIMAAGIGSRFGGGIKQLEPVGPNGEIIMDYLIHDALEAGFNKVVFIIRKDLEKDFREIIGNRTRAKVVKNKMAPPFREAEFDIMYGEGISLIGELIDLGVKLGLVQKSGSWYSMGETRIGQGRDAAKQYLKNNPEIADNLEAEIRRNFDKLMTGQSRVAAKAAGRAVDVSADDFKDED